MMPQPKVRPATEDDCPALTNVALASKAFWGYSSDFMKACESALTITPHMIEEWESGVIEEDGTIAGFYFVSFEPDEAELQLLYISPLTMGQGYGRLLLGVAAQRAVQLGYARMRIEADPNALNFYKRMGARQIGWCRSEIEDTRELPLLNLSLNSVK